jgi:transmembrane sensor
MDFTDYTDIDFVGDTYFVEWVTNPNPENDRFWQNWIANHPERTQELLTAKSFIQNLNYRHNHRLDDVTVEKILENIIHYKNDEEFKITPVKKWTQGVLLVRSSRTFSHLIFWCSVRSMACGYQAMEIDTL